MSEKITEVRPGMVFEWQEPGGRTRTMLVQRISEGPGPRRAWGIHPDKGGKLQCLTSLLLSGKNGARLLRELEGYVWTPVRAPGT